MNFRKTLCCVLTAAATLAVLTACQNGSSEESHVIPQGGSGSKVSIESSEATPESDAHKAAGDVYNAANMALLDMRQDKVKISVLSGNYSFSGSDCAGKSLLVDAESEAEVLSSLQGGILSYYPDAVDLSHILLHFEDGKCTATAVQDGDAFGAAPDNAGVGGRSYDSLEAALEAAIKVSSSNGQNTSAAN